MRREGGGGEIRGDHNYIAVFVLFFADSAINLGHEPEIQEDWTQLQEMVISESLKVIKLHVHFLPRDQFLEMEALKEEHKKRLNEQRQLIEVSLNAPHVYSTLQCVSVSQKYQPHSVVAQLKMLVNESDTQSEVRVLVHGVVMLKCSVSCQVYADDFLDAKIPVAEFVQKYKQLRKVSVTMYNDL